MRGLIIDPAVNGCRAVNLLLIAVKAWGRPVDRVDDEAIVLIIRGVDVTFYVRRDAVIRAYTKRSTRVRACQLAPIFFLTRTHSEVANNWW